MYAPITAPRGADPNWRTYDPFALPKREHQMSKMYARHVEDTGDAEVIAKTGVKGYTLLWELPSVVFPWSYGIDAMHLFYLNIAQYMRDHWANNFTPAITNDGEDEAYHICRQDWDDIDEDIERMVFPTAFGDKPRSIFTVRKAAEWRTWMKVISPVVLKGRLAEPFYSEWIRLVNAITIATDYAITTKDCQDLHGKFVRFIRHYEEAYYRYDLSRVSSCKPVFHALLHVSDSVRWLGPMWSYSQWVMERTCGLWTPRVKLKSQHTDRHLSLVTLHDTQLHFSRFAIQLGMLNDQSSPNILRLLDRSLNAESLEIFREEGVSKSKFQDNEHRTSLHTSAGKIRLNYAQVRALAEFLGKDHIEVPSDLTAVISSMHAGTIPSRETNFKVPAFKHLRINDHQTDQALYNCFIRSKRFERIDARDATFARFGEGYFGRVDFFFIYELPPDRRGGEGHGSGDDSQGTNTRTLMLACHEPIRVFTEDGLYRIHGGDPFRLRATARHRQTVIVDTDEIVGLVGVVYRGDKAFFVCRDSCYM